MKILMQIQCNIVSFRINNSSSKFQGDKCKWNFNDQHKKEGSALISVNALNRQHWKWKFSLTLRWKLRESGNFNLQKPKIDLMELYSTITVQSAIHLFSYLAIQIHIQTLGPLAIITHRQVICISRYVNVREWMYWPNFKTVANWLPLLFYYFVIWTTTEPRYVFV